MSAAVAEKARRRNDVAGNVFGMTPEDLARAAEKWERLTPRQKQVAALIADGMKRRKIAEVLGGSPKTVDVHCGAIVVKLEVPIIGVPRLYFALRAAGSIEEPLVS